MIRLLVADDHPVVREGIKRLISGQHDMRIVGEAAVGDEVLQRVRENDADLLLLDISMPGSDFLGTLQRVLAERPNIRVLVLSIHPEETYALRAFQAGASGYLTKDRSPEELTEAIRRIYQGGKYISAALAERLLSGRTVPFPGTPHEKLTKREYQILRMLGSGKRLKDIAKELRLSPKTISTHRAHILKKLNLKSTAELIRYTVEHGID
jgi:DNA-binding NarL/FixJ family response regulator